MHKHLNRCAIFDYSSTSVHMHCYNINPPRQNAFPCLYPFFIFWKILLGFVKIDESITQNRKTKMTNLEFDRS